jgi:hypothetical protein
VAARILRLCGRLRRGEGALLRTGLGVSLATDRFQGLLVQPKVAVKQLQAEAPPVTPPSTDPAEASGTLGTFAPPGPGHTNDWGARRAACAAQTWPRRFYGSVTLDSSRVGRDAGRIADEVIAHVVGLVGARVKATLEIEAEIPDGAPEQVVRTVTENCSTLKFSSQGFESE